MAWNRKTAFEIQTKQTSEIIKDPSEVFIKQGGFAFGDSQGGLNLRKWLKDELNRHQVPFFDLCCSVLGNNIKYYISSDSNNGLSLGTDGLLFSSSTGGSSLTSLNVEDLSPLFTSNISGTTSIDISFDRIPQDPNLFYASPSGLTGLPSFRSIVTEDLPFHLSGTTNHVSKFINNNTVSNSIIQDDGSEVNIGYTPGAFSNSGHRFFISGNYSPNADKFYSGGMVNRNISSTVDSTTGYHFYSSGLSATAGITAIFKSLGTADLLLYTEDNGNRTGRFYLKSNGHFGFGNNYTTPRNIIDIESGVTNKTGLSFVEVTSTTPPIANPGIGVLSVNSTGEVILVSGGTSTVSDFLDLTDTPNTYVGESQKLIRVNSGETGLEFFTGSYLTGYTETDPIYTASSWYTTTNNSANWDTAYSNRITSLTTTGNSGAATLISNVLNIPNYTIDGILPSQTGNSGKYLTTNGTNSSWVTFSGMTNPMTTLGDWIYGGVGGTPTRLAGNTTTSRYFPSQVGTGTVSAAPTLFDLFGTANTWSARATFSASNGILLSNASFSTLIQSYLSTNAIGGYTQWLSSNNTGADYKAAFRHFITSSGNKGGAGIAVNQSGTGTALTPYFVCDGEMQSISTFVKMRVGDTAGLNGIAGASAKSTLEVVGSFGTTLTSTASNLTLTISHRVIKCTAACTITLPTAVNITGREYVIKNTSAGTITIACNGAETIDGSTTKTLTVQYSCVTVVSDGANWIIINLI